MSFPSWAAIAFAAVVMVDAAVVVILLRSAPEGYEGPDGFHYLRPPAGVSPSTLTGRMG